MFFKSYYGAKKTSGEYEAIFGVLCPICASLTYHIDVTVAGVEGQKVGPDEVGLLIVPVDVENEALLLNLLHGGGNNCFDSP